MENKEDNNVMQNEKKQKNSNGTIILIVILVIVILGMGVYIAYDKGVIFSSPREESKSEDSEKQSNEDANGIVEEKPLDLSKCLNNTTASYHDSTDIEENNGLSMKINSDQKSVTLNIDWQIFGPLSSASAWAQENKQYQISGFSKNIKATFVGEIGQDAKGITLFYLMEDGTVEYTSMFVRKTDAQNNMYFAMNYTFDYSDDGRVTGEHFVTQGMINNVADVIKLYTVQTTYDLGGGAVTTIGAKSDGSFYDLGSIINNY